MLIANPIYDSVFKFLMEDNEVAKQLISAIIGEEILELDPRPQEQSAVLDTYQLTVFRLDFKAIIRTAAGTQKKVLIELQKSNHAFDIQRFRHYLGANYSQTDAVDGQQATLPLLPIYILGFSLSIKRPVLKIGRNYQDIGTGEVLDAKDEFIEKLSHDCFVVQLPSLPTPTRSKVEKLLSIFNQRFVFDPLQKWLLQFPGDIDDKDLRLILKRLSLAIETPEVKDKIQLIDEFESAIERELRLREMQIAEKEALVIEKEAVISEEKKRNEALLRRIAELEKQLGA